MFWVGTARVKQHMGKEEQATRAQSGFEAVSEPQGWLEDNQRLLFERGQAKLGRSPFPK